MDLAEQHARLFDGMDGGPTSPPTGRCINDHAEFARGGDNEKFRLAAIGIDKLILSFLLS